MTICRSSNASRTFTFASAVLLVLSCPGNVTPAEPRTAVTVDGHRTEGTLRSLEGDQGLVLANDDQVRTVALNQLIYWGAPAEPLRGPLFLFADGGLVAAKLIDGNKERVLIRSALLGEQTVPLEQLAAIVFQPPDNIERRDALLARVMSAKGKEDSIILENGDELTGTIELGGETLRLDGKVGKVNVELAKVAAVIFDPSLLDRPMIDRPWILVGLNDGSLLASGEVKSSGKQLHFVTLGGIDWRMDAEALSELVYVQPFGEKWTYLSDREPAGYNHVPFLDMSWPYGVDRSVTGLRLRCDGRLYIKGLGMHSASRLTYRLDRPYKRLDAEVGIDDDAQGRGSVVFRVFVGNEQRFATPVVRGGDAPLPISVDLKGATNVSLIVDFADHGDELDHADWLNIRLVE